MVDQSRRSFLRGRVKAEPVAQRMPWQVTDSLFTEHCSRCDACIAACPENIIVRGDGGYPAVDFRRGECTACGECVDACERPVFRNKRERPWLQTAVVSGACLVEQGVMCRSCEDMCEPEAIRFRPRLGQVSAPEVAADACSGCGACVGVCPSGAIRFEDLPDDAA